MKNYAIMRIDKKKTLNACLSTERHNNRTAKEFKNKDVCIVSLESQKMKQHKGQTYTDFFKDRTKDSQIRKNSVRGVEILMTFSNGAVQDKDIKAWALESFKFLKEQFGSENIFSCYLHLDETTPHLTALVVPIDNKGKLNASYYFGGRNKMQNLQTEYFKRVEQFGLTRGKSKEQSKAKHRTLKEYRAELDNQEQAQQETRKKLAGYISAFGEPGQAWDNFGYGTLTAYINGYSKEHNRQQQNQQQQNQQQERGR